MKALLVLGVLGFALLQGCQKNSFESCIDYNASQFKQLQPTTSHEAAVRYSIGICSGSVH
jgi:hypothetical protein